MEVALGFIICLVEFLILGEIVPPVPPEVFGLHLLWLGPRALYLFCGIYVAACGIFVIGFVIVFFVSCVVQIMENKKK